MGDKDYSMTLLRDFANANNVNKKRIFSLRDWCNRQGEGFPLWEVFQCIVNASQGKERVIKELIEQLTSKQKTYGRSSTVFGTDSPQMTIRRDRNGVLQINGYNPNFEKQLSGQHQTHDINLLRKDGQMKKHIINTRERMVDIGEIVRDIPWFNENKERIECAILAIKNFAKEHKISEITVAERVRDGKYDINVDSEDYYVVPKKTIKLNESQIKELNEATKLTEYKFYNNIQHFLSDLLKDPVGAKVPFLLQANNITRNLLLYHLKSNGIINKHQKISDTDSQGNPKTARMVIKYSIPKKDFAKKLKRLYVDMVAKNVKQNELNEEGECGAPIGTTNAQSSGAFVQPLFGVQRRKMPTDLEEDTTTSSVGNYQYTVPFVGDKETLARNNGEGSNSVNVVKESKKRKKQRKNDEGKIVPEVCPKCGSKVGLFIKGEPVFLCTNKKCNEYFGGLPFPKRMNEAMSDGFSYEKLKSIPSFRGKVQYCNNTLGGNIGKGSSRVVYQLDDEWCLKLAINPKGVAQNEEEYRKSQDYMVPEILTVQTSEQNSDTDKYSFIVSEYVLPAKAADFKHCLGITFKELQSFIYRTYTFYSNHNIPSWCCMTKEKYEELLEYDSEQGSGILNELSEYMCNYDIPAGDLTRIANWGLTKRNGNACVVILDNGLTNEIFNNYYSRR